MNPRQGRVVIKGYGHITAGIVAFLICEKKLDPSHITIFEEKSEIGGCWLGANTHSVTYIPIIGSKETFYPLYDRIQRVVKGSPINRETAIGNLRRIWEELKFSLVLGSKIVEENPEQKTVKVLGSDGRTEDHSYDWLISPRYRNMDSYQRSVSLRDGIRNIDLSKYSRFIFVGNSMNTAETLQYVVLNVDPHQAFDIKIYFRTYHPIVPRAITLLFKPGLPTFHFWRWGLSAINKFHALVRNEKFLQYASASRREVERAGVGGVKALLGDFLFHPAISGRIEFVQYSGDIDEIKAGENDLLIDTRNELASDQNLRCLSDHMRMDLGHVLHPFAGTYVTNWGGAVAKGINGAVWSIMNGEKPDDKYFRIAAENILGGKSGTCYWNYCHDIQARMVPFSYFLFPIDSAPKYAAWLMLFSFLRLTGLIAFFINLQMIEADGSLIDESEAAYLKLKRDWEDVDSRFGAGIPYPISQREFARANSRMKHSLLGLKKNIRFYKRLRYFYYALLGGALLVLAVVLKMAF